MQHHPRHRLRDPDEMGDSAAKRIDIRVKLKVNARSLGHHGLWQRARRCCKTERRLTRLIAQQLLRERAVGRQKK